MPINIIYILLLYIDHVFTLDIVTDAYVCDLSFYSW